MILKEILKSDQYLNNYINYPQTIFLKLNLLKYFTSAMPNLVVNKLVSHHLIIFSI